MNILKTSVSAAVLSGVQPEKQAAMNSNARMKLSSFFIGHLKNYVKAAEKIIRNGCGFS